MPVRWLAILSGLAACGGVAPTSTPTFPTSPPAAPKPAAPPAAVEEVAPIDPIAALAPAQAASYLVPGRVQIDLAATPIDGPGGNKPIEVSLLARQGSLVRVAVRLEHARFSVWTERAHVLGVLARDFQVPAIYRADDETQVVLREGAVVRRLAHDGKRTQIRYVGAVEVETWIPDDILVETRDAGRRLNHNMRTPSRLRPTHAFPGAVIRREPKWASDQLALVASAYMLTTLREIDQAWVVVAYADADVDVQGYLSRRDPPGRVHRQKDPEIAPAKIVATGKAASGTCLYARVKGEAVGYIVGDRDVMLDDLGNGWWTLTIDSPWGPMPFAARGPTKADLVACAPAGSVPAPAGAPPVIAP